MRFHSLACFSSEPFIKSAFDASSNVNVDGLGCVELDEVRLELPADHALENEGGEEVADKFQLDRLIFQLRLEKVQSPRIEEHDQNGQVQQCGQAAEESLNTEV